MESTRKYPISSARQCFWVVLLNTFIFFLLSIWLIYNRNVDGDEGLYLEAARLVAQGKKLYIDFFFQQMPLIPYFYAGWMKVFGFTLISARWLSAILTTASGFLVLWYVARRTRNLLIISLAGFFIYANGLALAWAPVIKTHPFNMFFLTAATIFLLEWKNSDSQRTSWVAWAGLLIGLGLNCRLTLAPYVLLFALFILVFSKKERFKNLGIYILAILIVSIPTLYYVFFDPWLFLKYNFYFHTKVFPRIADEDFRIKIAKEVFFQPQIVILVLGFYVGLMLESLKGWRKFLLSDELFLVLIILGFSIIHLFTATPFTQYFSAIIPLFVLSLLPLLEKVMEWPASFRTCLFVPFILVYLGFAGSLMNFELYSVGSLEPIWKLSDINSAVRSLKKYIRPGEYCLTWWPGYAFLLGCQSVPGMENHMREHAIYDGISWKTLNQYKMKPSEELVQDLGDGKYPFVIYGAYILNTPYKEYGDYLLSKNYHLEKEVKGVRLYTLNSPGVDPILESRDAAGRRFRLIGNRISAQHLSLQNFRPEGKSNR